MLINSDRNNKNHSQIKDSHAENTLVIWLLKHRAKTSIRGFKGKLAVNKLRRQNKKINKDVFEVTGHLTADANYKLD